MVSDEVDEVRKVEPDTYSQASPFARLFARPDAADIAAILANREQVRTPTVANRLGIENEGAEEVLDILDNAGGAEWTTEGYTIAATEPVGAAILRSCKEVEEETAVRFEELLSDPATVRVLDVFLRKAYHGVTMPMLVDMTGLDEEAVYDAQAYLSATGLITAPEEHPAEMPETVNIDEGAPAFIIDTDSDAAGALNTLRTQLVAQSQSVPPMES